MELRDLEDVIYQVPGEVRDDEVALVVLGLGGGRRRLEGREIEEEVAG